MSISERFSGLSSRVTKDPRVFLLGVFIFLAATISFSAGSLTAQDGSQTPIIIEKCGESV